MFSKKTMRPVLYCIGLLLLSLSDSFGFVLLPGSPRRVTKVLTVQNGGPWGTWHSAQYCPTGTFAMGYSLKIEGRQQEHDDTSLNGVKLHCGFIDSDVFGGDVTSAVGPWGVWSVDLKCGKNGKGQVKFLSSFVMQVEPSQGNGDDTAANFVKFKCRDYFDNSNTEVELSRGTGLWGNYGQWSESCPLYSAICGIKTKVEGPSGIIKDDTALNDIEVYCCDE